jgi:hypothetical protein
MNKLFEKLPFRKIAEKIPAETRTKVPVLNKVIPFANQITCGLVVVLAVVIIACSGGGNKGSSSGGGSSGDNGSSSGDYTYDLTEDGNGIKIKSYTGNSTKVRIPAKIEGIAVTEIGDEVFNGKTTSATFSGTYITSTSSSANENAGITSITIPNSVTKIGNRAFANSAITELVFPDNLIFIPEDVAEDCKLLKKVTLGKNTKYIGPSAFSGCVELTEINFPREPVTFVYREFFRSMDEKTFKDELLPRAIDDLNGGPLTTKGEPSNVVPGLWYEPGYVWIKYPDNWAFSGCSKMPIKTRQAIKEMGYEGNF